MPCRCMYRLIFMPKKCVVRNIPVCPPGLRFTGIRDGGEGEGEDLDAVGTNGVGHDAELHRLADGEVSGRAVDEPSLDEQFVLELDVAEEVRLEGLRRVIAVVGRG